MAVRFPLLFHALSSRSFNSVTKLTVSQFLWNESFDVFLSWKDPLIRWTGLAQESDGDGDPSCEAQVQNSASVPMTSRAKIGSRAYYNLLNPIKVPWWFWSEPSEASEPCQSEFERRDHESWINEAVRSISICSIWFHWFIWFYCFYNW